MNIAAHQDQSNPPQPVRVSQVQFLYFCGDVTLGQSKFETQDMCA